MLELLVLWRSELSSLRRSDHPNAAAFEREVISGLSAAAKEAALESGGSTWATSLWESRSATWISVTLSSNGEPGIRASLVVRIFQPGPSMEKSVQEDEQVRSNDSKKK